MIPSLLLFTALDLRPPAPQSVPHIWPGIVEVAWGAFGCFMYVEGSLTRPGGGDVLRFEERDHRANRVVTARLTPLGLETMEELAYVGAWSNPGAKMDSSITSGYFRMSYRREGELLHFSQDTMAPASEADTLDQFALFVVDRMRRCEDSEMIEILSGCD